MTRRYRKPHNYRKKKSIIRNRFFWLAIMVAGLIGFSFYFFFLSDAFQVENIIISGENKVPKESIRLSIEGNLENRFLFFPTKTILLVNLNDMGEEILNNFPQIAKTEIKRSWPDTINVLVVERKGMANWCESEKCFLLDNEGIVFEEMTEAKAGLVVIVKPGLAKLGDRVIEVDDLDKILDIRSQLETNFEIPIKDFVINSEDKLTANTQEGWQIYFNLRGDLDWQITKLGAVLEERFPPENRGNLEYIELRFGNLANPKYRD